MLSVQVDDKLVDSVDKAIKDTGYYSSRSEFLKDAIRKNLLELLLQSPSFREMHEASEAFRKSGRERGLNQKPFSKLEREKMVRAYTKERGWT